MTVSVERDWTVPGRSHRRFVRLTAVGVAAGVLVATAVGTAGGAAAADKPKAQSVGRFLDGSAGGMPIQTLVDLVDARAKAAPDTSKRNPLEAKLLGQLDVPIGNALQLPGGGALNLGAANQLADAKSDGSSLGASGAVSNSGGVSLGGDNSAFPADAKVNLSSALIGSVPVTGLPATGLPGLPAIPGLPTGSTTNLAALGGITADIGAVSAVAQTTKGGTVVTPSSGVATAKLTIGSPALGGVLSQLSALLNPATLSGILGAAGSTSGLTGLLNSIGSTTGTTAVTGTVTGVLNGVPGLGTVLGGVTGALPGTGTSTSVNSACSLTATESVVNLDDGAVMIDPSKATITIDLGKLVSVLLGKDISNLDTSNFDLVDFLVKNLPKILSTGLEALVNGITSSLASQFTACTAALTGNTALSPVIGQLTSTLQSGQSTLLGAINTATAPLVSASGAPLTALASGLKQVVDIGLNVQSGPGVEPKETTYPFTSGLKATPDQATAVVAKQTLVRAIEIDLLPAAASGAGSLGGLGTLPGLGSVTGASASSRQLAGTVRRAAAGGGAAVLALANAAVGPGTQTKPTPTPSTSVFGTTTGAPIIPTGVPAGAAGHLGGQSPALPIVLVLLGLLLAGGGVTAYRTRSTPRH